MIAAKKIPIILIATVAILAFDCNASTLSRRLSVETLTRIIPFTGSSPFLTGTATSMYRLLAAEAFDYILGNDRLSLLQIIGIFHNPEFIINNKHSSIVNIG